MNEGKNSHEVTLVINGRPVELNQFAGAIIGNVVQSMVQSLRLDETPDVIQLTVAKATSKTKP